MLPVGLVSLGAFLGAFSSAPSWLTLVVAVAGLFHGFRDMRRIEVAWRKAIQHYRDGLVLQPLPRRAFLSPTGSAVIGAACSAK